MRGIVPGALAIVIVCGCESDRNAAIEEARRQQETELAAAASKSEPPTKIRPPVRGETKLPCAQLIDPAVFTTALGEKEPLGLVDVTPPKGDYTSSCNLIRGGKKVAQSEQDARIKKDGVLGVLPGDVVCNVNALCSAIETPERFKRRCAEQKHRDDDTMGTFACVQVVQRGRFDVETFRFLDADTKCVLEVRGGPSNHDNDAIRKCAQTARDSIGPQQIAVKQ